jgi:hypothetical protein
MDSIAGGPTGGKPKDFYIFEFFRCWESYKDDMIKNPLNKDVIDITTALFLAICPDKAKRNELWDQYIELQKTPDRDGKKRSSVTASILATGDMWTYLSEVMEFTEEAYAGA